MCYLLNRYWQWRFSNTGSTLRRWWRLLKSCWHTVMKGKQAICGYSSHFISCDRFTDNVNKCSFEVRFKFLISLCHLSMQTPLEALQEQCNTTSATNSHVVLQLEHAQSLLFQFSEGLAEVSPWLEETQTLIGQLSLSTISHEAFREQQDLLQVEETCLSTLECQLFSFFYHPFFVQFNKEVLLYFCHPFPLGKWADLSKYSSLM